MISAGNARPLGQTWKKRLNLVARATPEFYETADEAGDAPHAGAIRTALRDLGLSAVFCVQDVPTVAILSVDEYDRKAVADLHAALWNQGLASLLLVISGNTVRAFSLARIPYSGDNEDFDDRCLIREFDAVSNALELKNIIYAVESGRLWEEHADRFSYGERIDHVLLGNLTESHKRLCEAGLDFDEAQILLIQAMFIAYLEDREIIGSKYFLSASRDLAGNFSELLETGEVSPLSCLFMKLQEDFNGDLFVSLCSFEREDKSPRLQGSHLEILSRFRSGRVEMRGHVNQNRFWGYDFKYIPVELISTVYDRFLGKDRRTRGAYYTPMFLADMVISQVWDVLSPAIRDKGHFLDPACGSGVFLVRLFQRVCGHWRRKRRSRTIRWDSLLLILSRLRGADIDRGAVRVSVFSLYLALLEEVDPPDLQRLIDRGRFLPKLWGKTLHAQDFFAVEVDDIKVDVLIGNPPWLSRRGGDRPAVRWCKDAGFPMPAQEEAWAFAWKSLQHLRKGGTVAFLLPAMGFLHNHSQTAVAARQRFIRETGIVRIINFCDLRFQLFESASRPAALIIYRPPIHNAGSYEFDYWVPKADPNLKTKRLITLSSADKCRISSQTVGEEPNIFKLRLWMNDPETKLFNYLSRFPRLGESGWKVGRGFQPASTDRPYAQKQSYIVANTPYLPISAFRVLFQTGDGLGVWEKGTFYRRGFEEAFKEGPRVLVPRGISTSQIRLRAAYVEAPLTFQDIIQSLVLPVAEKHRAKLLTALLNSSLISWFAFHSTASFGSERPEVKQSELLRFPFPLPEDMPEPGRSRSAEDALVSLIDREMESASSDFQLQNQRDGIFEDIDRYAYEFFCLSDEEITLVEDTVEKIIPAVQPRQSSFPDIWKPSSRNDRRTYADTLVRKMNEWFDDGLTVRARLEARNEDLSVLRLSLHTKRTNSQYVENESSSLEKVLSKLFSAMPHLPGNFQLIPDLRIFIGSDLYLVKPSQKRFWMKSVALSDAHSIALDLHDAVLSRNGGRHS